MLHFPFEKLEILVTDTGNFGKAFQLIFEIINEMLNFQISFSQTTRNMDSTGCVQINLVEFNNSNSCSKFVYLETF